MTKKHSNAETLQSEKKVKELEKTKKSLLSQIAERKKTKEALRKSKEQYRSLIESSDDPIYLVDGKLNYLYANKKLLSRYGKSLSEVVRQSYEKFHSPKATKLFSNRVKVVFKSGKPLTYEYRSQKDKRDFLRTLSPVIDQKTKEITAITVISKDITDRKQAENLLVKSEKKYRDLFEKSEDAILIIHNGKFVDCNQATVKMLRYNNKSEFLNTHPSELSPKKQADGKMSFVKANEMMKIAFKNGSHRFEWDHKRSDGEVFPVEVLLTAISTDEKDQILHTVWRDITERKRTEETLQKSEEQFRLITENTSDVITLQTFDLKASFTYVSPSMKAMSGYEPEELLGKSALGLLHPDDKKKLLPLLKKYVNLKIKKLLTGKELPLSETIEYRIKDKSGNWRYAQSTGNIVGDKLLFVSRDITERKRMEEKLQLERTQLLSIFDSINEIIYITDPETNEILYVNKTLKDAFKKDPVGGVCYKEFQGFDSPCEFCTNKIILKEKGKPYQWEYHNPVLDRDYLIIDKIIKWPDGRDVRFELARDITERKRAEEKLRESEERLKAIFKSAQDAIFTKDLEGHYTHVNPVCASLFELTLEEMIGKTDFDLFPPEVARHIQEADRAVIGTGEAVAIEDTKPTAGVMRTFHVIKVPLRDASGEVVGLCGIARDITERKQAEEALKKEKTTLNNIINLNPYSIQICDKDGYHIRENQAFMDLFNTIPPREWSILNDSNLKKAGHQGLIRKVKSGEIVQVPETWYNPHDISPELPDKRQCISSVIFPLLNPDGEVENIVIMHENFTERKRAEIIQQSLYKIATAVHMTESMGELSRIIQLELGKVLDSTNFFIALYNKKDDTISLPYFIDKKDHFETFPAGKTFTSYVIKNNKPLLANSGKINELVQLGEVEIIGTVSKVWLGVPLIVEEEIIGVIVVQSYTDENAFNEKDLELLEFVSSQIGLSIEHKLSDEKVQESEEKYRLLVENVNDAIVISQYDKFIFFNKQFAAMLGYKYDELLMKDYTEVYTEKAVEILMERQRIRNRGTEAPSRYETVFKKKDGEIIDVEVNMAIIEYRGDRATFAVIRDVTERKRIEKEARRNQNLESIGVLAGGIAHDFNNILTIILGNITLSKMYAKPEDKVYKRLVEAEKGAMRAKDLTQQLLTFSKGGAPVKETSSVAEFLKESAAFALSGSNVKCIFSIPDDIWAVEIDKGQINQVFNNLVMNADQAMPEGGILKINAENIAITPENVLPLQKGKYIKFSFEDHGIGIPAHHLDKIFDPYFSTKTKGSGLGLASAYSIIRSHNGLITVESELGAGTTFYIYLPASEEIVVERKAETGKTLFGKGKILIMDDEDFVREVAGEMVESLGYSAEFAKDGAEAIELYKKALKSEEPFSAVIMDLTIPGGMGGKEAIRELLKIDPNAKAIVSSGYSSDPVMSDCKKYGFMGVVAKPYKISELGKTLKEIILK